jgi:WD40 repeat protein
VPPVPFISRAAVTLALALPGLALLGSCRAPPAPREPDVEVLAPPPASAAPPQDLSDLPDCPPKDIDRARGEALEDEANALLGKNPTQAFALFVESCQLRARCPHARVGAALVLRALGKKARARFILDRTLEMLETGEEKVHVTLATGHAGAEVMLASPTSHRWAFVSGNQVSYRRGETLDEIRREGGPDYTPPPSAPLQGDRICTDDCTAAAFSPDGRLVAWTTFRRPVALWDVSGEGGPPVALAEQPAEEPFSVEFSPDGRLLAASLPEGIGVWEVGTRARLRVIPGKTPIAFSADGTRLTTSEGRFEIATGKAIQRLHLAPGRETRLLGPEGRWALSTVEWREHAQIHDLGPSPRAPRPFLPGVDIFRIAISRDEKQAVSASSWGPLQLWDLESGQGLLSWTPGTPGTHAIEDLVLSPSGRLLAITSGWETVDIWDMNTHRTIQTLAVGQREFRTNYVRRVAFSADEKQLLTFMEAPGGVQLWDLSRNERLARLQRERWSFSNSWRTGELSELTLEPGPRIRQGDKIIFELGTELGGHTTIEHEKQYLASLVALGEMKAGYVLLADGRIEIIGPDAALAEQHLFCRHGAERYPFALCEERLRGTNLLATLFP